MYDIIIRGGTVIDGSGKAAFRADVAVKDGTICRVGDLAGENGKREIDAAGLLVTPGFIDMHAHSDTSFLADSSYASKLYQGITTEVSGNCGESPFPALPERMAGMDAGDFYHESFDEFVRDFEKSGYSMAVNQAMLVGHGSLRAGVMGYEDRAVTADEMEKMKELLRRDMEAGAWGMSLGLEYSPGFFADGKELGELGRVVAEFDGIIPCHMRNEGLRIDEAIEELLDVGRVSGAKVHVSHLKVDNYRVHGRAKEVWQRIESAQKAGVRVTADMYPFIASCTTMSIRCPKWSQEGGGAAVAEFLKGPRRGEIIEHIRGHYFNAERAETCLFNNDAGYWPEIVGRTLRFVAEEYLGTTDYAEAAAEVLVRTHGRANCIFFVMSEEDMLYFMGRDVSAGSDGYALSGDRAKVKGSPHPRSYASHAEFFRRMKAHGLASVEETVRRMTGKPAADMGMTDRGLIREGMAADIAVFDGDGFMPRATYLDSVQLAEGMKWVVVNGQIALENGVQTDVRAGKFLRKTR